MAFLETNELYKTYGDREAKVHAVNGISIRFEENQLTAITGKSGSGKSTLLKMIALLEKPSSGCVMLDGEDITALSEGRKAKIRRRKFGYVFQDFKLLSEYSVRDNILIPLYLDGNNQEPGFLEDTVSFLGIDGILDKMPDHLSGGQQQRVAAARALIASPEYIFADEPTGNLDQENGKAVFSLLQQIAHEMKRTVIIVTHDQELSDLSDQKYVIVDGRISEE